MSLPPLRKKRARMGQPRKLRSANQPQFWQTRYYDFPVRSHEKRIEKLRYMHRHQVKRGLVERPDQWPWSSFQHYATGYEGAVEIESEWTARKRERVDLTLRLAQKQ